MTGGAGYIGSHCAKVLSARGFLPVVYDNLSTGHREFVKWGPFVHGDIRDQASVARTLKEFQPIATMHFAALALVGESVADPLRYWETNVAGTLSLLSAMRQAQVAKFVFSSTCAVYGEPDVSLIDEETPKNPVNPYGASKLAAERIIDDFAVYGIRSVKLRYFNAGGADGNAELGEDRQNETHLIPLLLDAARGRRPHIAILGNDYPTPDGTAIRDYIHVTDLANAHQLATEYMLADAESVSLNLGTGRGVSVAEMIAAAETTVGYPIPKVISPRRSGDPARLVANPSMAEKTLGWSAQQDVRAILADAWRWHLRRFDKPKA